MHRLGFLGERRDDAAFDLPKRLSDLDRLVDHAILNRLVLAGVTAAHANPATPERTGTAAIEDRATPVARGAEPPLSLAPKSGHGPGRYQALPFEVNHLGDWSCFFGQLSYIDLSGVFTNHMGFQSTLTLAFGHLDLSLSSADLHEFCGVKPTGSGFWGCLAA